MPELHAFETFCLFVNNYAPTYFYQDKSRRKDLIGAYAASYLSHDILQIVDKELFDHLISLPAHIYLFVQNATFQCVCKPFNELQKL